MISASSRWGCPIEDNLVDNNNGFNEQFPGFSKKNWASAFLKIRSLCLQLGSADFLLTFLRAFWKSSPTSLGLNCLSILGENSYHFLHPLSFVCFYFRLLSCKTHLMCVCSAWNWILRSFLMIFNVTKAQVSLYQTRTVLYASFSVLYIEKSCTPASNLGVG